MPAAPSSLARLRFAPAGLALAAAPTPASPSAPRTAGPGHTLDVPREEGLELLDWLGLGRPEFGAIGGRELAPRCRRRLWDVPRNAHPRLRARATELLAVAELAGQGMVLFG